MDVGSVMEHFSILQGPAGTTVSKMGDGMTRVTRECKSSSVEQSLTCVSGTALTRRSFPTDAAKKLCNASDPWSLQIMLCWGWFSSRKQRELSTDRWRVCQVDPKLDKETSSPNTLAQLRSSDLKAQSLKVGSGRYWGGIGGKGGRGGESTEAGSSTHRGQIWDPSKYIWSISLVSLAHMGPLSTGRSEARLVMLGGSPSEVLAIQGYLASLTSQELCGSCSDIRHILGNICKSQMAEETHYHQTATSSDIYRHEHLPGLLHQMQRTISPARWENVSKTLSQSITN